MYIQNTSHFEINSEKVVGFEVSYLRFKAWADLTSEIQGDKNPTKALNRLRLKRQVKAVISEDKKLSLAEEDITRLPILSANKLMASLDAEDEKSEAKLLNDGDGVTSPCHMKFGSPLGMGQNKKPLSEVEFSAKTYGDIEMVLAAGNELEQTIALLETCARPVSDELKLSTLPSTSISAISVSDGVFIMRNVLPLFLKGAEE